MVIKILGTGCPKCEKLEENVKEAVKELGIPAGVEKVTDLNDIMRYNVTITPGLVVDEELKASGKVLSVEKIKEIIGT
ncbi:MAG: TM0996/MTH895 family glutaredoxin-like protein [Spirochaetes bacterium]|nr:TM0996/MTH895 family glutaredoxin-like protein [Spirochaetota bacterium]